MVESPIFEIFDGLPRQVRVITSVLKKPLICFLPFLQALRSLTLVAVWYADNTSCEDLQRLSHYCN